MNGTFGIIVEVWNDDSETQALELLLSEIPLYHVSLVFPQLFWPARQMFFCCESG